MVNEVEKSVQEVDVNATAGGVRFECFNRRRSHVGVDECLIWSPCAGDTLERTLWIIPNKARARALPLSHSHHSLSLNRLVCCAS